VLSAAVQVVEARVQMKKQAGRPKDLEDIARLEALQERR
jgi:hypothetical protein